MYQTPNFVKYQNGKTRYENLYLKTCIIVCDLLIINSTFYTLAKYFLTRDQYVFKQISSGLLQNDNLDCPTLDPIFE